MQPTKNQKRRLATLNRRLAAVSELHQKMHFDSPTHTWEMKKFMAGLRRELGVAPEQKKAISVPDLKKIVTPIPATLIGKRDRAFCSWALPAPSGARSSSRSMSSIVR